MTVRVQLHDHRMCAMPGWRYDKSYQVVEYTFSNLDLTTLANIGDGDTRLILCLQLVWMSTQQQP